MKTSKQLSSNLRKGIAHTVVGAFALFMVYQATTHSSQWEQCITYLFIVAFYIHSLVSLPLITIRKQTKKYLLSTVIGFFVVTYALIFFEAMDASEMLTTVGGESLPPAHFFFQARWHLYGLFTGFLIFIPFTLFSLLYHILIISKSQRKELFSYRYTEFIINTVAASTLILLSFVNFGSDGSLTNTFELILVLIIFYSSTFIFIPKFLLKRRFLPYGISLFLSFAVFLVIKSLFDQPDIIIGIEDGYYIVRPTVSFFVAIFASFIYNYVRSKRRANQELFSLQLNTKDSELQLLKSQVNPHFLFNTLNTLYATSLKEEAPKTAKSIAKLANLIRYMQNDINKDFITLETEVNYVKDYIEIQKLRVAVEPEIASFFENIGAQKISPGLFIPLVENAFKYGIHPTEKSTITLEIRCEDDTVYFRCENAYDKDQKVHHMNEGFGIGIQNVEERLKLVYPEKHHFDIEQTDDTFIVKLTLQITQA